MSQKSQSHDKDNRPKWMLELENRRRKPRLAHEMGAGAPCLKCDAICPGLDLHFWRKICKNCKCGRDDHDVSDDEFPQFYLLLGPSGKSKRKCVVLKMNKQQVDDEETFEWAPPDTTRELAADYMKALPEGKLPIKGSAGAALRKQQLQKQLPLHDIDHEMCDELSDPERKQFDKYLENLKKYVGQGKVSKIGSERLFVRALITPVNASECSTPKRYPISVTSQPSINLRTPSSFESELNCSSTSRSLAHWREKLLNTNDSNVSINDPTITPTRVDKIDTPYLRHSDNSVVELPRYHHAFNNISNDRNFIQSTNVVGGIQCRTTDLSSNKLFHDNRSNEISDTIGNITDFEHGRIIEACQSETLKNIGNKNLPPTIDDETESTLNISEKNAYHDNSRYSDNLPFLSKLRRLEDIASEESIIENKLKNMSLQSKTLKHQAADFSYDVPHEYSKYSNLTWANEKVTDAILLPSVIHNVNIIGSSLDEKELSSIRDKLMQKYRAKDETGEYSIHHERSSPPMSEDLRHSNVQIDNHVSSIKSMKSNVNSMPIQMYMNSYKNPDNIVIRSEKLEHPVFPHEIVGTSELCVDNLKSVPESLSIDQSKEIKMMECHECSGAIHAGDVVVTAEKAMNAVWHPGCFVCCACNELLVDLIYFYHIGKLYCARDLADLMEIPRCFACDELIFVREYTVAEGHNYHVKHFCCWECDEPLAGKQYISENDRPLCLLCYQRTYAKLCSACNKLIAADQQGVAVKYLNFHATDQCFCCYNCNKSLLNGRMAIKENKPFCTKECITMYVNKNISSC